jgi:VIT1/CCC1 family predicted Fe2+/Mn2+ transporter
MNLTDLKWTDVAALPRTTPIVIPIAALLVAPPSMRIPTIAAVCLLSLAALGAFGGYLGGAPLGRASLRVTLGGALAMA